MSAEIFKFVKRKDDMRSLKKYILLLSLFVCVRLSAQVGYITCDQPDTVCYGSTGVMTMHDFIAPILKWQVKTSSVWSDIPSST
ncbi:MAG TPA: hypothetical protein VGF30_13445, partial [Bacteroidia bacterium]